MADPTNPPPATPPAPPAPGSPQHATMLLAQHVHWLLAVTGPESVGELAQIALQMLGGVRVQSGPTPPHLAKLRACAAAAWNAWQREATGGVVLAGPGTRVNGAPIKGQG